MKSISSKYSGKRSSKPPVAPPRPGAGARGERFIELTDRRQPLGGRKEPFVRVVPEERRTGDGRALVECIGKKIDRRRRVEDVGIRNDQHLGIARLPAEVDRACVAEIA